MSCNCNNDGTEAIHVYVELAGNEDYHSSLKGRDEADQHPISAITNLEAELESINTELEEQRQLIDDVNTQTQEKIAELASSITSIDEQFDLVNNKVEALEDNFNNYYTKEDIDVRYESVMRYKGNVTTYQDLPLINEIGDVYNVIEDGANYVWTGIGWDNLSPYLNLDNYATKDYVDGTKDATVDLIKEHVRINYYNKLEIDEKFAEFDPALDSNCFIYKGSVPTYTDLPQNSYIGFTYKCVDTGVKYFWDGFKWEPYDSLIDKVYTKEDIDNLLNYKANVEDLEHITSSIDADVNELKEAIQEVATNQEWRKLEDVISN